MKRFSLFLIQSLIVLSGFAQTGAKYTTVNLNLRQNDNSLSQVITVIPRGTAVTMAEDCDCEWILVSYKGQTGYVYSKYLSKSKPDHISSGSHIMHYTNSSGNRVQSPNYYNSAPAGATALCQDGTYSFSQNRRGTCSHHGGVKIWF